MDSNGCMGSSPVLGTNSKPMKKELIPLVNFPDLQESRENVNTLINNDLFGY